MKPIMYILCTGFSLIAPAISAAIALPALTEQSFVLQCLLAFIFSVVIITIEALIIKKYLPAKHEWKDILKSIAVSNFALIFLGIPLSLVISFLSSLLIKWAFSFVMPISNQALDIMLLIIIAITIFVLSYVIKVTCNRQILAPKIPEKDINNVTFVASTISCCLLAVLFYIAPWFVAFYFSLNCLIYIILQLFSIATQKNDF